MPKKPYEYKTMQTDQLIAYARNARDHSEYQISQLIKSIKEFGFTNPILIDSKGEIIAGHGRVQAALALDMKTIPCIIVKGLTKTQKKALVIADNQLALNASWDIDLLRAEYDDLKEEGFDVELLGMDDVTLSNMFDIDFGESDESEQSSLDEIDPVMVQCPQCDHEFDSRTNKC